MSRVRSSLALISILALSLAVAQYDEESEESTFDESEEIDDDLELTKVECENGITSKQLTKLCCQNHLYQDRAMLYCQRNAAISDLDTSTEKDQIALGVRIMECFFRRKGYITSRNRVRMTKVKADAAKLGDPAKAKFMVNMYKKCEHEGNKAVEMYAHDSRFFKYYTPHKLFVNTIFACLNNYLYEKECPHFYWFSIDEEDNQQCAIYAEKCETLLN